MATLNTKTNIHNYITTNIQTLQPTKTTYGNLSLYLTSIYTTTIGAILAYKLKSLSV